MFRTSLAAEGVSTSTIVPLWANVTELERYAQPSSRRVTQKTYIAIPGQSPRRSIRFRLDLVRACFSAKWMSLGAVKIFGTQVAALKKYVKAVNISVEDGRLTSHRLEEVFTGGLVDDI